MIPPIWLQCSNESVNVHLTDSCPGYYDRHAERVSMCGVRGTPMEPSFYDCKEQLPYICINGGNDYSLLQNCKDFQLSNNTLWCLWRTSQHRQCANVSYMLACNKAINPAHWLMRDHRIDDDEKTHVTILVLRNFLNAVGRKEVTIYVCIRS